MSDEERDDIYSLTERTTNLTNAEYKFFEDHFGS